jgi:uncharacterized OsmC-like protein
MAADPRRIAKVIVHVTMPDRAYSDKEKKILETAARTCPVSYSLAEGIEQEMNFVWVD